LRWTATPSLIETTFRLPGSGRPYNPPHRPAKKNALFAGHDAGAQSWTMLASLIETCKLYKIEPHSSLTGILKAIVNGHKQKQKQKQKQECLTSAPIGPNMLI
jgi:hypothetical protein